MTTTWLKWAKADYFPDKNLNTETVTRKLPKWLMLFKILVGAVVACNAISTCMQ
jgi:hypothetical protein